ncbi:type II secretion system minor pseudopilin GspK [Alisedimentitalea sp. MJ-SS2]|uniref:type II secretion system minor pseudopilin GspK n=1 Tax=Aliisedimentitalea sp. MJ-SS2 TaxID=3049795 RepID=UPI00290AFA19|nr:type II secretion system minor pseudopilin GspK [Alisedimentitalea sp. MJ-SS2]MDU8925815.1 type II secretion system minor pseudopilin GspK [Alisedimentitalea sp. MJ-SS2]
MNRARRQGGFVLVNALIIVAALSAAAVYMLSRAESGRVRAEVALHAVQLGLYLDGFESLARAMLEQDLQTGAQTDHPGEAWARAVPPVTLDRGQVRGQIRDLQGRFNLNRLADPNDMLARAAFERLAQRRGVSSVSVAAIAGFLSPDGPADPRAYAHKEVPERPVGGALVMVEQLRGIPGLSARDIERLAPFIAVLPADASLNINTISAEVLASFFPNVEVTHIGALVQLARRQPFASIETFLNELGKIVTPEVIEDLPAAFFAVGSSWFEVEIVADLDGRRASRRVVINRLSLPQRPVVAYRLDNWN